MKDHIDLLDQIMREKYNSELSQTKRELTRRMKQIEDLTRERDYYRLTLDQAKATITDLQQRLDQARQLNLSGTTPFKYCKRCSKEFIPKTRLQKFCSKACKRLDYEDRHPGRKDKNAKEKSPSDASDSTSRNESEQS